MGKSVKVELISSQNQPVGNVPAVPQVAAEQTLPSTASTAPQLVPRPRPPNPVQSSSAFRFLGLSTAGLSIVVTGAVAMVLILSARKEDLPKIAETLFESNTFAVLGWMLAVAILISSIILVKFMLNRHDKELNRVCAERDELQRILIERSK